jgi:hypothetical protein
MGISASQLTNKQIELYKKLSISTALEKKAYPVQDFFTKCDLIETTIPDLNKSKVLGHFLDDNSVELELMLDQVENKILLVGEPGSGKTALISFLCNQWAEQKLWKKKFDCIWMINLKYFPMWLVDASEYGCRVLQNGVLADRLFPGGQIEKLASYIYFSEIKDKQGIPLPFSKQDIETRLIQQTDILIFDGFNQVFKYQPQEKNEISRIRIDVLKEISGVLSGLKNFILTAEYTDLIDNNLQSISNTFTKVVELYGFSYSSQLEYVKKYFRKENESVKREPLRVLELLSFLEDSSVVQNICRLPFNLELLCYLWKSEQSHKRITKDFNLTVLFGLFEDTFTQRFENNSSTTDETRDDSAHLIKFSAKHRKILKEIAYTGFDSNQLKIISVTTIVNVLKLNGIDEQVQGACMKIIGSIGFLYPCFPNAITRVQDHHFADNTFQEYLAAEYIRDKFIDNQQTVDPFIEKYRYSVGYKRIFKFLAGLLFMNINRKNQNLTRAQNEERYFSESQNLIDRFLSAVLRPNETILPQNTQFLLLMELLSQFILTDREIFNRTETFVLLKRCFSHVKDELAQDPLKWTHYILETGFSVEHLRRPLTDMLDSLIIFIRERRLERSPPIPLQAHQLCNLARLISGLNSAEPRIIKTLVEYLDTLRELDTTLVEAASEELLRCSLKIDSSLNLISDNLCTENYYQSSIAFEIKIKIASFDELLNEVKVNSDILKNPINAIQFLRYLNGLNTSAFLSEQDKRERVVVILHECLFFRGAYAEHLFREILKIIEKLTNKQITFIPPNADRSFEALARLLTRSNRTYDCIILGLMQWIVRRQDHKERLCNSFPTSIEKAERPDAWEDLVYFLEKIVPFSNGLPIGMKLFEDVMRKDVEHAVLIQTPENFFKRRFEIARWCRNGLHILEDGFNLEILRQKNKPKKTPNVLEELDGKSDIPKIQDFVQEKRNSLVEHYLDRVAREIVRAYKSGKGIVTKAANYWKGREKQNIEEMRGNVLDNLYQSLLELSCFTVDPESRKLNRKKVIEFVARPLMIKNKPILKRNVYLLLSIAKQFLSTVPVEEQEQISAFRKSLVPIFIHIFKLDYTVFTEFSRNRYAVDVKDFLDSLDFDEFLHAEIICIFASIVPDLSEESFEEFLLQKLKRLNTVTLKQIDSKRVKKVLEKLKKVLHTTQPEPEEIELGDWNRFYCVTRDQAFFIMSMLAVLESPLFATSNDNKRSRNFLSQQGSNHGSRPRSHSSSVSSTTSVLHVVVTSTADSPSQEPVQNQGTSSTPLEELQDELKAENLESTFSSVDATDILHLLRNLLPNELHLLHSLEEMIRGLVAIDKLYLRLSYGHVFTKKNPLKIVLYFWKNRLSINDVLEELFRELDLNTNLASDSNEIYLGRQTVQQMLMKKGNPLWLSVAVRACYPRTDLLNSHQTDEMLTRIQNPSFDDQHFSEYYFDSVTYFLIHQQRIPNEKMTNILETVRNKVFSDTQLISFIENGHWKCLELFCQMQLFIAENPDFVFGGQKHVLEGKLKTESFLEFAMTLLTKRSAITSVLDYFPVASRISKSFKKKESPTLENFLAADPPFRFEIFYGIDDINSFANLLLNMFVLSNHNPMVVESFFIQWFNKIESNSANATRNNDTSGGYDERDISLQRFVHLCYDCLEIVIESLPRMRAQFYNLLITHIKHKPCREILLNFARNYWNQWTAVERQELLTAMGDFLLTVNMRDMNFFDEHHHASPMRNAAPATNVEPPETPTEEDRIMGETKVDAEETTETNLGDEEKQQVHEEVDEEEDRFTESELADLAHQTERRGFSSICSHALPSSLFKEEIVKKFLGWLDVMENLIKIIGSQFAGQFVEPVIKILHRLNPTLENNNLYVLQEFIFILQRVSQCFHGIYSAPAVQSLVLDVLEQSVANEAYFWMSSSMRNFFYEAVKDIPYHRFVESPHLQSLIEDENIFRYFLFDEDKVQYMDLMKSLFQHLISKNTLVVERAIRILCGNAEIVKQLAKGDRFKEFFNSVFVDSVKLENARRFVLPLLSQLHLLETMTNRFTKLIQGKLVEVENSYPSIAPILLLPIVPATKSYHCFLSHEWGKKEATHYRVAAINEALKARGIVTWFDVDAMEHNIRNDMRNGILASMCMIIFLTEGYQTKITDGETQRNNGEEVNNCYFEFEIAEEVLGDYRIPIVLEANMRIPSSWEGPVKDLNHLLYIDMVESDKDSLGCDAVFRKLQSFITQNEIHERMQRQPYEV